MKKLLLRLAEIAHAWRIALPLVEEAKWGIVVFVLVLLALSVLAGLQPATSNRVLMSGEIAETDIIAHRDLWVEDAKATQAQRKTIADLKPIVFDLTFDAIDTLRALFSRLTARVAELTAAIPATPVPGPAALPSAGGAVPPTAQADAAPLPPAPELDFAAIARQLTQELGVPIEPVVVQELTRPDVRNFIMNIELPWLIEQLNEGVVADSRDLQSKTGVLIRNRSTDMETLRRDPENISDVLVLLAQGSQLMRSQPQISAVARQAFERLLRVVLKPTLLFNRDATFELGETMSRTVKPVFYNIHKGDVVAYKGERITPETQIKIQALFSQSQGRVSIRFVSGVFLLALLISSGLLIAPSGNTSSPLHTKDFMVIAAFMLVTGLLAKGTYILGEQLIDPRMLNTVAYAFPVAGFAGLFALIFGSRRYWVLGLLLALFSTLFLKEGLSVFLCFFFCAMLNTALTLRAQTRQDVVRSLVPLFIGMFSISVSCALIQGMREWDVLLYLFVFVLLNVGLSIFILFAISPLLETGLHYSTRFRLMELMNMEQPLLQELMVTIPGTYHHSLVVSNLGEAGAKAIGANSLLCKVAALYHDVGKLARPEYFIENQFEGPNKHDRLAPAMSALILASHVKKGTELGRKFHLGDDITDIIQQHHGTSTMRFFFNKAKEMGEDPKPQDYSYPGPRPQTREAAVLMLADVVEASSRTLTDPTPARLTAHVNSIMKNIFVDGQLDESTLTFNDMHKLADSFVRILTGLFHHRIAYPGQKKSGSTAAAGIPAAKRHEPAPNRR